jgi:hypothetical protein
MTGNCQVRFLGGDGTERSLTYPILQESSMAVIHDFSNWSQKLYEFSVYQFTVDGWLTFDKESKLLSEAHNVNELRKQTLKNDKYAFWAWWLKFGVAVECLMKAVFLSNEESLLSKKNLLQKAPNGRNPLATSAASKVYSAVSSMQISSSNNNWLDEQFQNLGIKHPLEIDSGTLGDYKNGLSRLLQRNIITASEQRQILDSLEVFSDIRRNVDAHVILKSQTGGSINRDLVDVYLPMCNCLIAKFRNTSC